jgi:hypothetical protein
MKEDYFKQVLRKAEHIGAFTLDKVNRKLEFKSIHKTKAFTEIGDLVYFFIHKKDIHKIGETSSQSGFYSRKAEYTKTAEYQDSTTSKIINYMITNDIKEYDVVAIRIPRKTETLVSAITGSVHTKDIRLTKDYESIYISEAYMCGYTLPLNREANKHDKSRNPR